MQMLYAIAAAASAVAAVLAWVAKIWWTKEQLAAKQETIAAKEAQIGLLEREVESYRELTPMKIREYFQSVKQQLEEYNDLLQQQLGDARKAIGQRDESIKALEAGGVAAGQQIEVLKTERNAIAVQARALELRVTQFREKYESDDVLVYRLPKVDLSAITQLGRSSLALSASLAKWYVDAAIPPLSAPISEMLAKLSQAMRTSLTTSLAAGISPPDAPGTPLIPTAPTAPNGEADGDAEPGSSENRGEPGHGRTSLALDHGTSPDDEEVVR